jgi:predicted GNAT family acetyltransferase
MTSVVDNPRESRFELDVEGCKALAFYRPRRDGVVLTHTEVPKALEGRGIGSKLAKGVFEHLRETNRKAILECSFMAAYAGKHPELHDLVEG